MSSVDSVENNRLPKRLGLQVQNSFNQVFVLIWLDLLI